MKRIIFLLGFIFLITNLALLAPSYALGVLTDSSMIDSQVADPNRLVPITNNPSCDIKNIHIAQNNLGPLLNANIRFCKKNDKIQRMLASLKLYTSQESPTLVQASYTQKETCQQTSDTYRLILGSVTLQLTKQIQNGKESLYFALHTSPIGG